MPIVTRPVRPWNYLRVRGEYMFAKFLCYVCVELPPRARRILVRFSVAIIIWGTTSACAENTSLWEIFCFSLWNYLRVRGEYASTPR